MAGFSPAPANLLGVVPYAISVWSRRRELYRERADAEHLRRAAARAAEDALARLGRSLLTGDDAKLAGLESALEAARQAVAAAEGTARSDEHSDEAFAAAQQATEQQLQGLRREVDPLHDRETRLSTQLAMKEQDVARIRARLQRIEIELRNLPAGPGPSRSDSLEAERAARDGELQRALGPTQELTVELAEVRRLLGTKNHDIATLESQLRQGHDALRREHARRAQHRSDAVRSLDVALRALGESARAHGLDSSADPALAAEVERKAQALRERARVDATYRFALDAYDRAAFRKGAGVLGGAAALILAMFVAAIVT